MRQRRELSAVMSLVIFLALLAIGCVQRGEAPSANKPAASGSAPTSAPAASAPAGAAPTSAPAAAGQSGAPVAEVKIGIIYPLSGAQASTGTDLKNGVELAVDIVNNRHDLNLPLAHDAGLPRLGGAKLVPIFGDHQGTPEKGLSETERLITVEKVVAVSGAFASAVTNTASQAAERLGVPFLTTESTSPALTQRGLRWFFRTTPDDDIFAANFFDFLRDVEQRKNVQPRRIAIGYENTLFGTDVSKLETKYAGERGYQVVADVPYPSTTSEVTSEVQRLKASNADVIMMTSYVSDAILFTQTFKQLDVNPQGILAMDAGYIDTNFLRTAGKDAEYLLSREVWALDIGERKPLVRQVNDLFRQRYGTDMNGNSARAFTGILVLADAINRAGSTEPNAIREALLATDLPADQLIMPWEGVRFDPATGQNVRGNGIIVQVRNGKYVTVWPWDLAAAELVWPVPAWRERP